MEKVILESYLNTKFVDSNEKITLWDIKHADSSTYTVINNIITGKMKITNLKKEKTNLDNNKEYEIIFLHKNKIFKLKTKTKDNKFIILSTKESIIDIYFLNKKTMITDKNENNYFINVSFIINNPEETSLCLNINKLYKLSYIKSTVLKGEYSSEYIESILSDLKPKNIKGRVENDIYYLIVTFPKNIVIEDNLNKIIQTTIKQENIKFLTRSLITLEESS